MWIHRLEREFRSLGRAVHRSFHPLNRRQVLAALHTFGPVRSKCLLVHSSLAACGHLRGGPGALLGAWQEWLGAGTLAIPTHSYCWPDAQGHVPVFDVRTTPSVIGAVSDYFWRQPGVVRSVHPSHSLACAGPLAEALCRDHERCETPCGPGTPYRRLIDHDCAVLMFGVSLNTYTLFYTAMDEARVPYLYQPAPAVLQLRNDRGEVQPLVMRRQNADTPRRFAAMDGWLEQQDLLRRVRLGLAELLFIPQAARAHRALVAALRQDPLFLVAPEARAQVAAQWGL